jgi:hypothetical protein
MFKLLAASVLVGASLSAVDMSSADILARIGMTPDRVVELIVTAFNWMLPNVVLGSIIVLPLWGLAYVLRPPRS